MDLYKLCCACRGLVLLGVGPVEGEDQVRAVVVVGGWMEGGWSLYIYFLVTR